jgi:2-methylcitrate dehydratase PrpD
VAAGLLRGLSPEGLAAAMVQALALPIAARLWQPMEGGTVRNAWTGLGAYYGARAAAEAETRTPMDQELASAALMATVTGDSDLRGLGEGLGSRWSVLDSYLKPYACARWIHPALDAMSAALAARRGAAPSAAGSLLSATVAQGADIERIEVDTFAYAASLSARDLRSDMHARFSLPTCLATLALDGELHAAGFLPDRLARPGVRSLANRVVLKEDATFSAALPGERPTTTTIVWRDGRQTSHHVRNARGNPDDPLPLDEVVAKFHSNVATVLPGELAGDCETAILTGSGGSVLSRVALVLA